MLQKQGIVTDLADMPSRTTISRCLDFVYQHCKAEVVKAILKECPDDVALTSDQWTDKHRSRPYNTCTLHFWDSNFEAVNLTLKTSHFPRRHTGVNILRELESTLEEFGLQDKNVHMVTDAGKNNKISFDSPKSQTFSNFSKKRTKSMPSGEL